VKKLIRFVAGSVSLLSFVAVAAAVHGQDKLAEGLANLQRPSGIVMDGSTVPAVDDPSAGIYPAQERGTFNALLDHLREVRDCGEAVNCLDKTDPPTRKPKAIGIELPTAAVFWAVRLPCPPLSMAGDSITDCE
jgi:hypothetical protein